MLQCPKCESILLIKSGIISTGKQRYLCKDCTTQFVEEPKNKIIPQETWDFVDKLLLEKIPIVGIARVTNISATWLQKYVNKKYSAVKKEFDPPIKKNCNHH